MYCVWHTSPFFFHFLIFCFMPNTDFQPPVTADVTPANPAIEAPKIIHFLGGPENIKSILQKFIAISCDARDEHGDYIVEREELSFHLATVQELSALVGLFPNLINE